MELEQCVNSSLCLPHKPKLVVGLRGSTSNIFVDNAAYRKFLVRNFHVSSVDMESAAVVMVSFLITLYTSYKAWVQLLYHFQIDCLMMIGRQYIYIYISLI